MTAMETVVRPRLPDLTDAQREAILAAVAELVRATAADEMPDFADSTLAGAAALPVAGAFISLKRGKHLRGCCGGLQEQPVPLGRAVWDAAVRTVQDDPRFPPVSPRELSHLQMEIWLLSAPEVVPAQGEERVAAVTVGKHGLVLQNGTHRGLLLPGVAVDHGWDARRFLEQACVKAGLHPHRWLDGNTTLKTFEGRVLRGRTLGSGARNGSISQDDLAAYLAFCRSNLRAFLTGALPTYYFGAPDGTVSGVALSVGQPDGPRRYSLFRFNLRPGVPLQGTLFSLVQEAARVLAAEMVADPDALDVELTILTDTTLHGTAADPDLAGVDGGRAVMVLERARAGLAFDARRGPEELLAEAARQAQVRAPEAAGVFSFEALTTGQRTVVSTAPLPQRGPVVRPAAMAGRFYPGNADACSRLIDELLAGEARSEPWPAAMVPHAGVTYSGKIAAAVFRRLRIPKRVIIFGPKHTPLGVEWAVAPHQTWAVPNGQIASDTELAERLVEAIPGLALDAAAHQQEHGIEVELPFLAKLAPATRVVGVVIGHGDYDSCVHFAEGLARVVRECDEPPLLLISSDMNHYAPEVENRRLDLLALDALARLDPREVYETVTGNHISMCGLLPAVVVMETLKRLGSLTKAERVGYATSADAGGDPGRVVGYAGMLFG